MSTVLNRSVTVPITGITGTTTFGRNILSYEPNPNSVIIAGPLTSPADIVGTNAILAFDGSGNPTNLSGAPAVRSMLGGTDPIADTTLTPPGSLTLNSGIVTAGS